MEKIESPIPRNLENHVRILEELYRFFTQFDEAKGIILSGSTATGKMDQNSDLDLGIYLSSTEVRDSIWKDRWNWDIAPWFHRFDADHIKEHFVIYFFEPNIKVDINLYVKEDLPHKAGAPYFVLWERGNQLESWNASIEAEEHPPMDWEDPNHDDERIWAWMLYLYGHINRGEYYLSAIEYVGIREILETWQYKINGLKDFNPKYLEWCNEGKELLSYELFPKADRDSLKAVLQNSIKLASKLRPMVAEASGVTWKTSHDAIEKISRLIEAL